METRQCASSMDDCCSVPEKEQKNAIDLMRFHFDGHFGAPPSDDHHIHG